MCDVTTDSRETLRKRAVNFSKHATKLFSASLIHCMCRMLTVPYCHIHLGCYAMCNNDDFVSKYML